MAKYIVKRVAMGIFSVFIVATLTFFIMNLVPGGRSWRKSPSVKQPSRLWPKNTAWTSPWVCSTSTT